MELIKIEKKNGIESVSAKELYDFLELDKSNYSRWIQKNIVSDEFFINGVDYQGFVIKTNGNETKEYAVSLDMAKELCMLARNEKGKEARQYFINVEKKAKELLLDKPKKQEQLDHKKMAELRRAFEKGLILADEYRTLLGFNYEKPEVLPSNIAKQVYAVAMSALEKKKTKDAIAIKSKDLWE